MLLHFLQNSLGLRRLEGPPRVGFHRVANHVDQRRLLFAPGKIVGSISVQALKQSLGGGFKVASEAGQLGSIASFTGSRQFLEAVLILLETLTHFGDPMLGRFAKTLAASQGLAFEFGQALSRTLQAPTQQICQALGDVRAGHPRQLLKNFVGLRRWRGHMAKLRA